MSRHPEAHTPPLAGWLAALLLALALLHAPAARAQTPAPLAEWQYSVGVPLVEMFQGQPEGWKFRLGAAMTVRPRYDGAHDYYVFGGPTIDIRYADKFFASTGEGLGWNIVSNDHWRAGIALTYDLGRREKKDHDNLAGMGNIGMAAETKMFVDYVVSKSFPLVIRANARRQFGGANGWIGDLGAYMPLPGSSEKFFWFAGPTMTVADSAYMGRWFGVTPEQAARSGHPEYRASGGIKSYGGGVSAIWFINKHWFATADFGVSALVGDAKNSPIVQRTTNLTGDISVVYQF
ncbi:Outer membrane scaffolding protein for murein synthesis, MipA/OmpV family [Cupriavidus sp. OV038]|nr:MULTISPECIES: MipA/OmpV family protein [unclassified Cupriavidus]SFC17616.1 Outer membrane scaffolding protein for murein synthesis, MipA/OmpV family [Cupriavidus sp. OV038]SFP12798.1 Outer membrane scaffolding protein for murein synthesis, MipA/OmpV family [Cupriavidus sp. OV096]